MHASQGFKPYDVSTTLCWRQRNSSHARLWQPQRERNVLIIYRWSEGEQGPRQFDCTAHWCRLDDESQHTNQILIEVLCATTYVL